MAEQRDVQALAATVREGLDGYYNEQPPHRMCEDDYQRCLAALDGLVLEHTRQEEQSAGLLAELDEQRALFRAMVGGQTIDPAEARAVLAVGLAEHVTKWMPELHRGHTLTKSDELTLAGITEMADDVAALSPPPGASEETGQ